jgi:hypothetical protein
MRTPFVIIIESSILTLQYRHRDRHIGTLYVGVDRYLGHCSAYTQMYLDSAVHTENGL